MRKSLVPGMTSTIFFILVALYLGFSGMGNEYIRMFLGEVEDESVIATLLIIAYIPAFFAGLLSPLFDRNWRAAVKTAFISSVMSLVLGIIISLGIGYILGLDAVYGYVIWMAVSAPLHFGISLISIIVGYIVLLVLMFTVK